MGYKRGCGPMAASFGVTGGLRNPYMINFTTEGAITDQSQNMFENKIREHDQLITSMTKNNDNDRELSLKNAKDNYDKEIARIDTKHRNQEKKIRDTEIEHTKQVEAMREHIKKVAHAENVKEESDDKKKKIAENKKVADLEYEQAQYYHNISDNELQKHHNDFLKLHKHGTHDVQSTSNNRLTDPNNYPEVDSRGTGNSKGKTRGGIGGRISSFFKGKGVGAENELDFEDITHFSAPRENRCTYI